MKRPLFELSDLTIHRIDTLIGMLCICISAGGMIWILLILARMILS